MSCILRSLDNPLLSGLALGLSSSKEGLLSVSPQFYPCCTGAGQAWDNRLKGYHVCALKERLVRLNVLMAFYSKCYPDSARLPFQVTPAWCNQILQELAGSFKRDRLPATVSYTSRKAQASVLWSKAFAAIWRFGMDVRFCRLTDFDPSELSQLTKVSPKPFAIFIDQIDKLWDPQILEALEFVIQQTYNSQAFLWMEFVHEPMVGGDGDAMNLRQSIARKLSKMKDKHPLDYLGPDALSRLHGLAGIHHKTGGQTHA